MIDLNAPANLEEASRALRLVASPRRPQSASASGLEAAAGSIGTPERMERLNAALARISERDPRPDTGLRAAIAEGARLGLSRADETGVAPLTRREVLGLEAVVLTDGTRPSLIVSDGFVDLTRPEVGDWDMQLAELRDPIRRVIRAVGRINVPVQQGYAGTCFVVADGLVATNRHVLQAIAAEGPQGIWTLNWPSQTTVDFCGEEGAPAATKFPVEAVVFAGGDPIEETLDFAKLDVALLRVDAAAQPDFPKPLLLARKPVALPADRDLYTVGFPGRPRPFVSFGVPGAGTETAEVIAAMFGLTLGVKRLAPGNLLEIPGTIVGDTRDWVFSHDASTLVGSSGSCVVDLGVRGDPIVGIHFGGRSRAQNWAHSFAPLRSLLAAHGVTFG
jgi:hypothetical protein